VSLGGIDIAVGRMSLMMLDRVEEMVNKVSRNIMI
jgi:hypothetical protein